jgi:hypothetical protein
LTCTTPMRASNSFTSCSPRQTQRWEKWSGRGGGWGGGGIHRFWMGVRERERESP